MNFGGNKLFDFLIICIHFSVAGYQIKAFGETCDIAVCFKIRILKIVKFIKIEEQIFIINNNKLAATLVITYRKFFWYIAKEILVIVAKILYRNFLRVSDVGCESPLYIQSMASANSSHSDFFTDVFLSQVSTPSYFASVCSMLSLLSCGSVLTVES